MNAEGDRSERAQRHWRDTRRLTAVLLLVWAVLTFGLAYNARALNFAFFGWPFSFWAAAQGLMAVYLGLVVAYAVRMERLDRVHGLDEQA